MLIGFIIKDLAMRTAHPSHIILCNWSLDYLHIHLHVLVTYMGRSQGVKKPKPSQF